MAVVLNGINSEIKNNSSQETLTDQAPASSKISIVKKRSPLVPQFRAKDSITSREIGLGAQKILHAAQKSGEDPFQIFLKQNPHFSSQKEEEFEASMKREIESDYFTIDQWNWNDLYDKDNLLLCLSAIQMNKPTHNRNRVPAFMGNTLTECDCRATRNRNSTDRAIVDKIERSFTDKEKKLKYVSFGSDGSFADWVILSNLILLGHKNVEVHLTHPNTDSAQKMKEFFENYPDVKYSVTTHKTFRDFTKNSPEPSDIVVAIDFNGDTDTQLPPPKVTISEKGFSAVCSTRATDTPNWELVDQNDNKLVGVQRNLKVVWPKA